MVKVLFTVHTYYPNTDGVQFVTQYLAEGLVCCGNDVTVITGINNEKRGYEIYKGVKILRIPVKTKCGLYFGNKEKYQKLVKKLAVNIDVMINVCTQNAFTDLLLDCLGEIDCKKVLYMHGMFEFKWHRQDLLNAEFFINKLWKTMRWGWLYCKLGKYIHDYDEVIQLSEHDDAYKYFLNKYGVISSVIENATEDDFFQIVKNKKRQLICVANYEVRKNQEFVMHAFYKAKIPKDFELIFVGSRETNYLKRLKRIKTRYDHVYGTKKVSFYFGIDRSVTKRMIKESMLSVLGSLWEGYPIFLVESMASGVPFISTNVGQVEEMPGGVIVDNDKEMVAGIEWILNCEDNGISLGNKGHNYALKHYKIEDKVRQLISIIEI